MNNNEQDRYGSVILSEAKNLASACIQILRFAQNDSPGIASLRP